jgi:hypothetical protein
MISPARACACVHRVSARGYNFPDAPTSQIVSCRQGMLLPGIRPACQGVHLCEGGNLKAKSDAIVPIPRAPSRHARALVSVQIVRESAELLLCAEPRGKAFSWLCKASRESLGPNKRPCTIELQIVQGISTRAGTREGAVHAQNSGGIPQHGASHARTTNRN